MKRTVKHHKSKKKHSREGNVSQRKFTVDEKKAAKYGPVNMLMEEDVDESESGHGWDGRSH